MPIELIDKIKPKNNGTFALVDAEDISIDELGTRLNTLLDAPVISLSKESYLFDRQETTKLISAEISSNPFGNTTIFLERLVGSTFTVIDQQYIPGGIITFNLNKFNLENSEIFRLRAVNAFNRSTTSTQISVLFTSVTFISKTDFPDILNYENNIRTFVFNFDSINLPENIQENEISRIELFLDGYSSKQIGLGDTTCSVEISNVVNGYMDLLYYLKYTLTGGREIKSAVYRDRTYLIEKGTTNFLISAPNDIYTTSPWKLNITPIFDIEEYSSCDVKFVLEKEYKETFSIADIFVPTTINLPPIGGEESRQLTITVNICPSNSEEVVQTQIINVNVIKKDIQLLAYYDASNGISFDNNSGKYIWENIASNNYNMIFEDTIGSPLKNSEISLSGDTYGIVDLSSVNLKGNEGFTIETYIKSSFLGNLNASALNVGDILNVTYDKVNFTYANATTSSEVLSDTYHHIVAVCDLTTSSTDENLDLSKIEYLERFNNTYNLKIYIDGVLSSATMIAASNIAEILGKKLYLSKYNGDFSTGKNSTNVKYIKIYRSPLNSADIYNNYLDAVDSTKRQQIERRNDLTNILELWFVRDTSVVDTGLKGPTTFDNLHKITRKNADTQNRGSKTSWVNCDIWYKLQGGTSIVKLKDSSQKDIKSRILLQGTSTLAYPVKNYRFCPYYDTTNPLDDSKYNDVAIVPPGAPSDWVPDTIFTLKCDYMESSHRNNTPTAKFYQDKLLPSVIDALCNTSDDEGRNIYYSPARRSNHSAGSYRDAIDGYACVVYYVDDISVAINENNIRERSTFAGSYMFNIDKEGLQLGFEIQNGSNTLGMVSYEGGTNSNIGATAFKTKGSYEDITGSTIDSYADYIEETVEARFSSLNTKGERPYLSRFENLITFLNSDENPLFNKDANVEAYKEAFKSQFSYEYCMAYYIQMMLFAQVDSAGKNAMFDFWIQDVDSINNNKVFLRPYDMDTQVGLSNFGNDDIPVSAIYNETLAPDSDIYLSETVLQLSENKESLYRIFEDTITQFDKETGTNARPNTYVSVSNKIDFISFNKDIILGDKYYITTNLNYVESVYYDILADQEDNNITFKLSTLNSNISKRMSWSTNQSILWKTFASIFSDDIITTYSKLRNLQDNIINAEYIDSYISNQSTALIGERIYNADAAKRYLNYKNSSNEWDSEYYRNIQGTRNIRYFKYLRDRIKFLDSYFNIQRSSDSANFRNGESKIVSNTQSPSVNLIPNMYSPTYVRVNVDQGAYEYVKCVDAVETPLTIFTQGAVKKNMYITGFGNAYEVRNLHLLNPSTLEISNMPDLITLNLGGCSSLTGNYTISNKPYLAELYLNDINNPSLSFTLDNIPNIQKIVANNSTINSISLPSALSYLENLNLEGTILRKFSIKDNDKLIIDDNLLLNKDQLREISIVNCSNIAGKNFVLNRADFQELQRIEFKNNSVEDLTISSFNNIKIDLGDIDNSLTSLTIRDCSLIDDETFLDLSNFNKLTTLSVINVPSKLCIKLPTSLKGIKIHSAKVRKIYTNETLSEPINGIFDFTGITLDRNIITNDLDPSRSFIYNCAEVTEIHNMIIESSNNISLSSAFNSNGALRGFYNCSISGKVYSASLCFAYCRNLVDVIDMEGITFVKNEYNEFNSSGTFRNCPLLDPQIPLAFLEKLKINFDSSVPVNLDYYMYSACNNSNFNLNLGQLPKYISIARQFMTLTKLTEITAKDVDYAGIKIRNMHRMFSTCTSLTNVPENLLDYFDFNSAKCTDMTGLFDSCINLTINSPLVTKELTMITEAYAMFYQCESIDKWEYVDIMGKLPNVRNFTSMYQGCKLLNPSLTDSMFNNSNIEHLENIFANSGLEIIDLPKVFGPKCTNLKSTGGMFAYTDISGSIPNDLFEYCKNSIISTGIGVSMNAFWYGTYRTVVYGMFTGVKNIIVNLIDLLNGCSNLTNISGMFANIDIQSFNSNGSHIISDSQIKRDIDINKVSYEATDEATIILGHSIAEYLPQSIKDQSALFANCNLTENTDDVILNYIAPYVKDISAIFYNSNISNAGESFSLVNFESLENADYAFSNSKLEVNLNTDSNIPLFPTSIKTARYAFNGCTKFKDLHINSLSNLNNVTDLSYCFAGTGIVNLPVNKYLITINIEKINNWNLEESFTSSLDDSPISIESQGGIFRDCYKLTNVEGIFANCSDLEGRIPSDLFTLKDAFFNNITSLDNLFSNCIHLGRSNNIENSFKSNLNNIFYISGSDIECKLEDREVTQNIYDINNLEWKITKDVDGGKYILSVVEDKFNDNYLFPVDWLNRCPNIKSLNKTFMGLGIYGIDDTTVDRYTYFMPETFAQPFEQKLESLNFSFANTDILGQTVLTNNIFKGAYKLKSIKGLFYYSKFNSIDKNSPIFSKPDYRNTVLSDIRYAFYARFACSYKSSELTELPDFSNTPVRYFPGNIKLNSSVYNYNVIERNSNASTTLGSIVVATSEGSRIEALDHELVIQINPLPIKTIYYR